MTTSPRPLAFVSQKGGVGKTTSAVAVAQLLALDLGVSTTLVDLDPQGSAADWASDAEASGSPLAVNVVAIPPDTATASIPRLTRKALLGADVGVIDTPPGHEQITIAAIEAAANDNGVVIIPTGPTAMDLPRAARTLAQVRDVDEDLPVVVLLTRVRARTRSAREARAALEEIGATVLEAEIPMLEVLALASETTPAENSRVLDIYRPVAEELLDLLTHGAQS